jgi:hypothetical protein
MKLLPKEHGATAIWFSSLLLAFGTLREPPSIPSVIVFLAASVLTLVLTARITSDSAAIVRLERNATLLPILSSLLTLIVPLGQIIMVRQLSIPVIGVWLVFLAYCSSGVVYARDLVRSVLKETPPKWASFSLATVFTLAVVLALNAVSWLSIAAVAVIVPLTVHRVVVPQLIRRKVSLKVERIREVGFTQAGNLITATIILAFVSKL